MLSKHIFDQMAFTPAKLSGTLSIYPYVRLSLRVRRKWVFYVYQLGLPIFLMVSFSFGTLFVQASVTLADRLQITLSMVATFATYNWTAPPAPDSTGQRTGQDRTGPDMVCPNTLS